MDRQVQPARFRFRGGARDLPMRILKTQTKVCATLHHLTSIWWHRLQPVSLALLLAATVLHAADDWPQFRGNPSLTGIATSAVPKTLKLLWTFEAGDSIESSAAIVDGT